MKKRDITRHSAEIQRNTGDWYEQLYEYEMDNLEGLERCSAQFSSVQFSSVQFSSVQSLSRVQLFAFPWMRHARPPCPSPTSGIYSNSCPPCLRCHPALSFSVIPLSSRRQSLLASGSFPVSQLFSWGGQSIGVSASASVLPMKTDLL